MTSVIVLLTGLAILGAVIGPPQDKTAPSTKGADRRADPRSGAARAVPGVARVVATNVGFENDEGSIRYGVELANRSKRFDAVSVVVTVRAVDAQGRATAKATTPISLIPAGATFNLAGGMYPSVSLKASRLRVSVHVDRVHRRGLVLPRVTNVRLDTSFGQLLDVYGRIGNPYAKPLSANAPIYVVFLDRSGRIIGSTVNATGAAIQPRASIPFRVDGVLNHGHAASARVSVEACTFVRCL